MRSAALLADIFDAELARRDAPPPAPLGFRQFAEEYCRLSLSPMVAAIIDASEGIRPTTISDEECLRYFGCALDDLPRAPRRTVAGEAGGRGGKSSRLLAPKALHAAWTVPLPTLNPNEHAVSLVVSSEVVFARQALSFCIGYVEQCPELAAALVGKPGTDSLTLRRPDGKLVDVRVRAAGARGKGGRAFTLVGAHLDEACFFFDDTGVVNDREIFRACSTRIVPGGQLWMLSTPWIQGVGKLEEELATDWGKHRETLCFRGVGTRALNPTWDPTGEIEAQERRTDPENADREIGAIPLTAGSRNFFSREAIELIFNDRLPQKVLPTRGALYGAGGDAGFKRNSSALAIVERIEPDDPDAKPRFRLALLEERKPSPGLPLLPKGVAAEFAELMGEYSTKELVADPHERDDIDEVLTANGMSAVSAPEKSAAFVEARTILHEGRFEAPENPRLRQQLRDVMAKPMPGGGTQITSPQRPDGSHGDLVSALVLALWAAVNATPPDSEVFRSPRKRGR